jgi:hypothetical protein
VASRPRGTCLGLLFLAQPAFPDDKLIAIGVEECRYDVVADQRAHLADHFFEVHARNL